MPRRRVVRKATSGSVPDLAFQDEALLTPGPLRDRLLANMAKMGARDIRTNVYWGKVRDGGSYDFSKHDELVDAARKHGLRVQMTLMGTPRYMPQEEQELSWQNPNPELMGRFASDVANHFKGRVGRYSVWNEPNYEAFLGDQKNAPLNYRRLYQAGYKGVKSADPKAQVLFGELMPGDPHRKVSDRAQALTFMRAVLKRGSKPLQADGVAIHPYQWFSPNKKVAGRGAKTYAGIGNLPLVQRVLAREAERGRLVNRNGNAVPLYLTEFGYKRNAVPNEAQRAAWLAKSYRLAQEAGARQYLQYQLVPGQKVGGADPVVDAYGRQVRPGVAPVVTGGSWDTSVAGADGEFRPEYVKAMAKRRVVRRRRGR